jgi:hypothetical protein
MRELRLLPRAFGEPAALDTAVSGAILEEVSAGEIPPTLRLHRLPGVEVTLVADGHPDGDEEMVQVWSVPPGESDPPPALGGASTTIAAAL